MSGKGLSLVKRLGMQVDAYTFFGMAVISTFTINYSVNYK